MKKIHKMIKLKKLLKKTPKFDLISTFLPHFKNNSFSP